ncbi:MAG: pyruvate dehydrogenase (acetyl-transferring) E1 component subunit alpha [Rhodospirillales bacterium]|nr:pyruvate dehydrogenase (acetyl-transferring) E1 component subunit alpha [Rhodospirillales bacterium]
MKRKTKGETGKRDPVTARTIATFAVPYLQHLDKSGQPVGPLPPFADDAEVMTALYKSMVLIRTFDGRAISLQRTGQLGTYPSCLGQEAIGTGVASVMAPDDVLLTTYREQAAHVWRGVTLKEIFQYWGGDERGSDFAGPRRDFPVCVTIAAHAVHAVGVATAMKLRHEPRVAVCILGDGATSKGDFYEALNLAGVWRLPVVFVINNNQWAISVPRHAQTAAETLAQKAIAGGFEGVQVDGNDIVAVRQAATEAIETARAGGGPGLIEALSYRMSDHTTADDAGRYRPANEASKHRSEDPVTRLRAFLGDRGWWSKEQEESLIAECKARVEEAKEAYLAIVPEDTTAMFDHLYETLPPALAAQRKIAQAGDDE